MSSLTSARPSLLRHLNERAVFEYVLKCGNVSRSVLTRGARMTAPTVQKAVANLLKAGYLEMVTSESAARVGRPSPVYRVARDTVQVIGVTIDVRRCAVTAAGLDGVIRPERTVEFITPATYAELIETISRHCSSLINNSVQTLGIGVSAPGEIEMSTQRVLLSPNLRILDNSSPASDLSKRLSVQTILFHETTGTCLAEQGYGAARGMRDFVMIGVYEGFGASIVSGGRLLAGRSGLGGEMGHITVDLNGEQCGCGNRGCLETVATDQAFAKLVSASLGKKLSIEKIIEQAAAGTIDVAEELDKTLSYLAVGIAAACLLYTSPSPRD